MKKLIKTSIGIFLILLIAISCKKEEAEEPIINELELKENNLCQTWNRDYMLIDGDTIDPGSYYSHITFKKNEDFIFSLYQVDDQGITIDTIQYFSQWRWADHSNAVVAQNFFDIDDWYFYNIKLLEKDKMILEENSDNGVYIYSCSAVGD